MLSTYDMWTMHQLSTITTTSLSALLPIISDLLTGSSGDKHLVRLFRDGKLSQYCTCESTFTCFHIMAAMISIDYYNQPRNDKSNLIRYRKNEKKRTDSKSRTKKKSKPLNKYGTMKRKEAQV